MNEVSLPFFNCLLGVLEHPLLTNGTVIAVGIAINGWWTRRQSKKASIEINREAEKIKFEIGRKYLLTEIRTRNVLEIYPKLFDAMLSAVSPSVGYFKAITAKIEQLQQQGAEIELMDLISLLENYLELQFKDGNTRPKELREFHSCHLSSTLYISQESNKIVNDIKGNLMILLKIIEEHVQSGKCRTYDKAKILEFLDSASITASALEQDKDHLGLQMNRELNPYQD